MSRHFTYFIIIVLLYTTGNAYAATNPLDSIAVRVGWETFTKKNSVVYLDINPIAVTVNSLDPVLEITLTLKSEFENADLKVGTSSDFTVKDSMIRLSSKILRFSITPNLPLVNYVCYIPININKNGNLEEYVIPILPVIKPVANFLITSTELHVGEEKNFNIEVNNNDFFRISSDWIRSGIFDYRIAINNDNLKMQLTARSAGKANFKFTIPLLVPMLVDGLPVYEYDFPAINFNVNVTRIAFLNLNKKEITLGEASRRDGVELIMENHISLEKGRIYKVEDVEKNDTINPLIAELYVKEVLRGNRVRCIMRPEMLHAMKSGYLYLKMNKQTRFIINLNITPPLQVTNLSLLHEGGSWDSESIDVYPGETVFVKVEGVSLHKKTLDWEGDVSVTYDTTQISENVRFYKMKIPISTTSSRIFLRAGQVQTGKFLQIKEYQRPRPFDFVILSAHRNNVPLTKFTTKTYISRQTLRNIRFDFDNKIIDQGNDLYGKQYLDFDIQYFGAKGELIEFQKMSNYVVFPDQKSTRGKYYEGNTPETPKPISVDELFHYKMRNLEDYSKILITVSNSPNRYKEVSKPKEIEIVIQRPWRFDIDVSLPAGLMVQNLGQTKSEIEAHGKWTKDMSNWQEKVDKGEIFITGQNEKTNALTYNIAPPAEPKKANFKDNIGNISVAVIGQISFPEPNRVGRVYPWRVGVGFLVLNALNLASTTPADLALIAVASVYPLRSSKLFNLPIHIGVGYRVNERIPFVMISPGISVRF